MHEKLFCMRKENKMNQTFMKEKPILPLVVTMSLPMVVSMLVNSLYNIIDSFFVAKISEDAMTALSLVFPLQNFINAVGVGFGIGINAAVSYFLGAQEQKNANSAAAQGLLLTIVHGVVMTVGCIAVIPVFLRAFTDNPQVLSFGLTYSRIVFAFAMVIQLEITFEKLFQSVGRMVVSMIGMMGGCVTNIILDPILIFGVGPAPEMGIAGAALATGIGQVAALSIYIIVSVIKPLPLKLRPEKWSKEEQMYKRLYGVGIPATLNMALPSLLITVLNGILAAYGQMYVLILGIYYKLQTFIYLTANGIVQGIRPLVGYNYGAGEMKRVRGIFRTALGLAALVMAVGMILCLAMPGRLIGLFTVNEGTVNAGAQALFIICFGFVVSAVSVTTCGALEGMGKGTASLIISLLRYIIIMIPAAFLLSRVMGASGVWHGFWVTELVTAICSYLVYRRSLGK